jgi:hypothetical protein
MLLGVVSLMAESITGVPMSPGYGGYQTATPPPYYPKATYATTSYCPEVYKYYTTKAPEFYTTIYAAPSHYTDVLKLLCPELLHHQGDGAGLHMLRHPTTPRLPSITMFSATYCTDFPKYCCVPSCYTEAPADYSTKTVEYYRGEVLLYPDLHNHN